MKKRKIEAVKNQIPLKNFEDDWEFWSDKSPIERLKAVTMLVRQNMTPGQKMDKTAYSKILLKR